MWYFFACAEVDGGGERECFHFQVLECERRRGGAWLGITARENGAGLLNPRAGASSSLVDITRIDPSNGLLTM